MKKQVANNKMSAAISKLIELTQKNKIEWVATDAPKYGIGLMQDRATAAFETEHKGKHLRIYRKLPPSLRHRYGTTEELERANPFLTQEGEGKVNLEIIDDRGNVIWRFSNEEMLEDLLSAVQYKASGAQDFIDDLLAGE